MPASRRQGSSPRHQAGPTSSAKARQPSGAATGLINIAQPISRPIPARRGQRGAALMANAMAAVVKGAKSNSAFTDTPPCARL